MPVTTRRRNVEIIEGTPAVRIGGIPHPLVIVEGIPSVIVNGRPQPVQLGSTTTITTTGGKPAVRIRGHESDTPLLEPSRVTATTPLRDPGEIQKESGVTRTPEQIQKEYELFGTPISDAEKNMMANIVEEDKRGKTEFNRLVKTGEVPKGSHYYGVSRGGSISYIPDYEQQLEKQVLTPVEIARGRAFRASNTRLPDGQFVRNTDLEKLKTESPLVHAALTTKGFAAADKIVTDNRAAIARLKSYTSADGIDGAAYLRDHPRDRKTLQEAGFTGQQIADWRVFNAQLDRMNSLKTRPDIRRAIFDTLFLPYIEAFRAGKEIGKKEAKLGTRLQKDINKETQKLLLHEGDIAIPGFETARKWTTLSTEDKKINIAIDVAAILLTVGIVKLARVAPRVLSRSARNASTLANEAGKAGRQLDKVTKAYQQVQRTLKPGSKRLSQYAMRVAEAEAKSVQADKKFLNGLTKLKKVDLALLEKQSGLKGLKKALTDVNKALTDVQKARTAVNRSEFHLGAEVVAGKTKRFSPGELAYMEKKRYLRVTSELDKTLKTEAKPRVSKTVLTNKQRAANRLHLIRLQRLQQAQARLEAALNKAGSTLKPRYTEPPPASRFRGYGMQWEPGKPSPKVGADPSTTKAIENYLARSRELQPTGREPWVVKRRTGTTVAEKPKVAPAETLKLKGIYEEAKPKPTPKPEKVPKVTTGTGIAPVVSVTAVAKTIKTNLERLRTPGQPKILTTSQVRNLATTAVEAYAIAQTAGKTKTKVATAVKTAVEKQATRMTTPGISTAQLTGITVEAVLKPQPAPTPELTPAKTPTTLTEKTPPEKTPETPTTTTSRRPSEAPPITIERVENGAGRKGIVAWRQGKYQIEIVPPYREGTKDVRYSPSPRGSTGTPQQTIRTRRGKPPREIGLGMGVVEATVHRGRRIVFRRRHIKL